MKQGIHPQYNVGAITKCTSCGTDYEFGTIKENMTVAICAHCHPFYTGEQQVMVDTANKICTFKEKVDKATELKKRQVELLAKKADREKSRVGVISSNAEKRLTLKDLLKANQTKAK